MMTMEYNHDLELQASKEEGFEEGIDSGIRSSVKMLRSVGTSDTVIATKLMEEFNLTREEALAYIFGLITVETIINMYKKRMNPKDTMEICEVTADKMLAV